MPYTPEQNGREKTEPARSLMHSYAVIPQRFWAEMINTPKFILNFSGSSSVEDKFPLEVWTGKKSSLKHLRIIDSTCYAHIPKQNKEGKEENEVIETSHENDPDNTGRQLRERSKMKPPRRFNDSVMSAITEENQMTADCGIHHQADQKPGLQESYIDAADHGRDNSGRSTSGVICLYAGGALTWLSQKQTPVAISTTEAEIVAASEASRAIIWLILLFF
ncbi:hypothetical protein JTB14_004394 [Gonioctena quinquepunctata]|nr:hypothetical protein JTB14_004394 [Gonioctena quinquepunctata]